MLTWKRFLLAIGVSLLLALVLPLFLASETSWSSYSLGAAFTLLIGFVFALNTLLSQGKLELLPGSEKIYFNKATQTHRLVGTVSFIYQGNTMYCDSAHYREKDKIVL